MTDEQAAFIRAIAAAWDDPLPVLVYADYAEERGLDDPALLRWYASEVMPAIAAVTADGLCATQGTRNRARRAVRPHPQGRPLWLLAAVAFFRRPEVWSNLTTPWVPEAVRVTRLFALGLATAEERRAVLLRGVAARKRLRPRLYELQQRTGRHPELEVGNVVPPGDRDGHGYHQLCLLDQELRYAELVADVCGQRAESASMALCRDATRAQVLGAYQMAMYLALANVPPVPRDSNDGGTGQPVGRRFQTSMHRPGGGTGHRLTVDGREYQARLSYDWPTDLAFPSEKAFLPVELAVVATHNTGQLLRVRFGYPVWHFVGGRRHHLRPSDVTHIIRDALAAGWEPTAPGLPDFVADGRAYLPPASETTFG